jgi:hypothetical protein
MRTSNSGASWTVAASKDGSLLAADGSSSVTSNLSRVRFFGQDKQYGWIVGEQGTVLRSVDHGVTWRGINTATTAKINDISCNWDSSTCLVAANDGYAFRITGGTTSPVVENISARVGVTTSSRNLLSAGVANASWYIGLHNGLQKSFDGGDTWTAVPMNYVQSDVARVLVQPDGMGFAYGGNATAPRYFTLHDFMLSSRLYTSTLNPSLPANAKIWKVNVRSLSESTSSAGYTVSASNNGGTNALDWQPLSPSGPQGVLGAGTSYDQTRLENGIVVHFVEDENNGTMPAGSTANDLRLRFTFTTGATSTHQSVFLDRLVVNYTWYVPGSAVNTTDQVGFEASDAAAKTSYLDMSRSTATWNSTLGAIHSPVVPDGWVRNVSGEVTAVLTGYNVKSDWHDDVWVATGSVLSGNSPEYAIYAQANESLPIDADYHVYLLDGKNGTILATSPKLPGKPIKLGAIDADQNGYPEQIMTLVVNDADQAVYVYGFNATTFVEMTNRTFGFSAYDMVVGRTPGPFGMTFAALKGVVAGGGVASASALEAINSTNRSEWHSLPDDRGKYTIAKEIPRSWFFGPYAVEVTVSWTETVSNGQVSNDVLQSASFYDYFLVTPPDALSPPSPVYNVELQTWLRDWR